MALALPTSFALQTRITASFFATTIILGAQSEPVWTQVDMPHYITYQLGATQSLQPPPNPSGPYNLQVPQGTGGDFDDSCVYPPPPAGLNYWYGDGSQPWIAPGLPVVRTAAHTVRSDWFADPQLAFSGIEFQARFINSTTTGDAVGTVFYHDDPCYAAAVEYGFWHRHDATTPFTKFYYSQETNCGFAPNSLCWTGTTGSGPAGSQISTSEIPNPALLIPASTVDPSQTWIYDAYMYCDAFDLKFRVQVKYPEGHPQQYAVRWATSTSDPQFPDPEVPSPFGIAIYRPSTSLWVIDDNLNFTVDGADG